MTNAPVGENRPRRSSGRPSIESCLLDAAADGELPGQPAEHEQEHSRDDAHHEATVARPGDPREERDEVDDLQRRRHRDRRHEQAAGEEVEREQRGHEQGVAPAPGERHGAGDDGAVWPQPRVRHVAERVDAAQQLDPERARDEEAQREHGVAAERAGRVCGHSLPLGVDAEPCLEAVGQPVRSPMHAPSVGTARRPAAQPEGGGTTVSTWRAQPSGRHTGEL